jgi:hypothetical protein
MRWAQRLKRVFGIDVETWTACGGAMRIVACIEDPVVIKAILVHLAGKARPVRAPRLPPGKGIGWADRCARQKRDGKQARSMR